ncbi:MAG: prolipoprotein diacylglyceryl transferase [Deltaproteobacteria bacterium]|nr:prolipoprotein diacylglyceryl transferase [Deltaproteobacteria bacterium]
MEALIGWQSLPFHINPNLLEVGSFQLRYYSLMYLAAFGLVYLLVKYRIRKENYEFGDDTLQDYVVWAILGVILGGRLGYVLFYNPGYYMGHPLEIFLPFTFSNGFQFTGISGMSYHGGLLGFIFATALFCRKAKIRFWRFIDLLVPVIPLGYTFGRIGNFINGELYGRATDAPWGMIFPSDPEGLLRHPSQLYEAFFEGIVLFAALWMLRRRSPFEGFLAGVYLIGYGIVRFAIEFYREPDSHLGFVLGPFSMGQILCLVMILCGVAICAMRRVRK